MPDRLKRDLGFLGFGRGLALLEATSDARKAAKPLPGQPFGGRHGGDDFRRLSFTMALPIGSVSRQARPCHRPRGLANGRRWRGWVTEPIMPT